jgi:hypothetical protein
MVTIDDVRRAAFAAMFLLAASPVFAGPPFVTDDPEPVPLHHWEVYIASMWARGPDGTAGDLPHVEVNYGGAPNLQLHMIVPYNFSRPAGGPTHRGLGDVELGFKYRFVQEGTRRPMAGIFPLFELPTGDEGEGLGTGHFHAFLPLWLQKSWGSGWTSYGGGGYWINPGAGNRNYWLFGWLLQKDLDEHLTLGGEIAHQGAAEVGGSGDLFFNLGGQYNFTDEQHLLFSIGRSIEGDTESSGYVAFQWTFPAGGD